MSLEYRKSNLYDSIINEIEKIAEYDKSLSKFNLEEYQLVSKSGFDLDIMGFIQLKNQDIMMDKLLRSFVNIKNSLIRFKTSLRHSLVAKGVSSVTYNPETVQELYNNINAILKLRSRRKIYDKELNQHMNELSFMEYLKENELQYETYFRNTNHNKLSTVSIGEFRDELERIVYEITFFMDHMMCELENRTHIYNSTIVMKHVFHVTLLVSIIGDHLTIQ